MNITHNKESLTNSIKEFAKSLGFDECGICKAESIGEESVNLEQWINDGYHADMDYLARNLDKRSDPTLLVEGAKSIVCVALNYYPKIKQDPKHPQIAYYAYGKDYHEIVRDKLSQLYEYIKTLNPDTSGRYFCDTAPVLERYWAAKSGIGFIGKNTLLIIPKKGSYFFLGEIILNLDLQYDKPLNLSCGNCSRCLDACPPKAIEQPHLLNANKCISYQTIENKGEIALNIIPVLNNRFYGCDICQQVCPWNRYATPHSTQEFLPSTELLSLDSYRLENMSVEEYQSIFKGSAMKRAKLSGLKRNIKALTKEGGNQD